jgi:hypothetical protein
MSGTVGDTMLLGLTQFEENLIVAAVSIVGTALASYVLYLIKDKRESRKRHRFEEEHPVNINLLEKLIRLRGALHALVGPLGYFTGDEREKAAQFYNEYKDVVQNNEPILHPSVFAPAREIDSLAREIINTHDKSRSIEEGHPRSARRQRIEKDEQQADELLRLDDENETSLAEIDRLFEVTKRAITQRVRP